MSELVYARARCLFGFTGREHELDSGLVYARQRYVGSSTGRFIAPDRLSVSVGRSGGLAAEPGLRQMLRAAGGTVTDVPEYSYAASAPTVFADPSGLTVVYVWVGGTAATFSGGVTAGLGMGMGGSPFALAFLGTFGLAQQLSGMINVSVSADLGIYPWLANDSVLTRRFSRRSTTHDPDREFRRANGGPKRGRRARPMMQEAGPSGNRTCEPRWRGVTGGLSPRRSPSAPLGQARSDERA